MPSAAVAARSGVDAADGLQGDAAGTSTGLAGSRARLAALAAILVQMAVLVLLDWVLAVPGAFLWMLASGTLTFAAVAAWERRRPAPETPTTG